MRKNVAHQRMGNVRSYNVGRRLSTRNSPPNPCLSYTILYFVGELSCPISI